MPPDVFQTPSFPTPGSLLAERDAHLQPQKSKAPASPLPARGQPQMGRDLSQAGQLLQPGLRVLRGTHRLREGMERKGWEASGQAGECMLSDESPEKLPDPSSPFSINTISRFGPCLSLCSVDIYLDYQQYCLTVGTFYTCVSTLSILYVPCLSGSMLYFLRSIHVICSSSSFISTAI